MSAILLSTILLVSPASSLSTASAQPPSLVEPESGAWAVVHAGELWVCWRPGPDCFERIVFDDDARTRDDAFVEDADAEELVEDLGRAPELGVDDWRMGFWGAQSLWIERDEQRWRVLAGQRRAQIVEDPAPIRLVRIGPAACGPDAIVPAVIGGRLSWRDAPRCSESAGPTTMCVTRAGPRVRRPTSVRLRASVEIAGARAWKAGGEAGVVPPIDERRLSTGLEVSFVVELGFDWQRRAADRRAAAMIARRTQARLRELPTVPAGPLADAEREALAALVCEGGQP
ncbi:MAG TPA: hypothetical protein VM869_33340 [Enhygromyxa sp.]|nr:hypothetical protein [Enhygromyxa sp.]